MRLRVVKRNIHYVIILCLELKQNIQNIVVAMPNGRNGAVHCVKNYASRCGNVKRCGRSGYGVLRLRYIALGCVAECWKTGISCILVLQLDCPA